MTKAKHNRILKACRKRLSDPDFKAAGVSSSQISALLANDEAMDAVAVGVGQRIAGAIGDGKFLEALLASFEKLFTWIVNNPDKFIAILKLIINLKL